MTQEEMLQEIERLKAENTELKKPVTKGDRRLAMKVSEKKALSVYGLGRFPVTLFKDQWRRLLDIADEIRQFIKDHDTELAGIESKPVKNDKAA